MTRLEKLKSLCAAPDEKVWRVNPEKTHPWVVEGQTNIPEIWGDICKVSYKPFANFIAQSRNELPALLALVKQLARALEKLRDCEFISYPDCGFVQNERNTIGMNFADEALTAFAEWNCDARSCANAFENRAIEIWNTRADAIATVPEGWQPIESVPQNRIILLFFGNEYNKVKNNNGINPVEFIYKAKWGWDYSDTKETWICPDEHTQLGHNPTAWFEIPQPTGGNSEFNGVPDISKSRQTSYDEGQASPSGTPLNSQEKEYNLAIMNFDDFKDLPDVYGIPIYYSVWPKPKGNEI